MSLTTTRQDVAEALASSGYSVYAYPSETMIAPCIVMVPGSPYVSWDTPTRQSVKFQLTLVVVNNNNQAALGNLEQLIEDVSDLIPTYVELGDYTQPQITTIGSTDYLTSDITLAVTIN